MARTDDEIQEWLSENMPDGPQDARQEGIQEALDWVLDAGMELTP